MAHKQGECADRVQRKNRQASAQRPERQKNRGRNEHNERHTLRGANISLPLGRTVKSICEFHVSLDIKLLTDETHVLKNV
jgi:hypothetical protein